MKACIEMDVYTHAYTNTGMHIYFLYTFPYLIAINTVHRLCIFITKLHITAVRTCMWKHVHTPVHAHKLSNAAHCQDSLPFPAPWLLNNPAKVQKHQHLVPLHLKTPSPWVCGRVNQTPSLQGAQWKVWPKLTFAISAKVRGFSTLLPPTLEDMQGTPDPTVCQVQRPAHETPSQEEGWRMDQWEALIQVSKNIFPWWLIVE